MALEKKTVETRSTSRGDFVKDGNVWSGVECVSDYDVAIYLKDVSGEPELDFFETIEKIDTDWPDIERETRNYSNRLTQEHHLSSIDGTSETLDFTLGFFLEKENSDETVYLEFKDGKIVDVWAGD